MSLKSLAAVLAIGPVWASAAPAGRFEAIRQGATPLGGLGAFLQKYVGDCAGGAAGNECRTRATEFRRQANGKKFYMVVSEDAATMIAPAKGGGASDEVMLFLTPFFPANGYALTHGAPKKSDANGNPILPLIVLKGQAPEGMDGPAVARLAANRALRLQVVFTPRDLWLLPGRGSGKHQGVRAAINAVLVTEARSGEPIATWVGN